MEAVPFDTQVMVAQLMHYLFTFFFLAVGALALTTIARLWR